MHVSVSEKNPTGLTIRDQHLRRLQGTYLGTDEIESIFNKYDRKALIYPTPNKLNEYKNADMHDEQIAVWTDYFNKKFNINPPLDPNVVKALIASESGFHKDPPNNPVAIGIAQITKPTLKILQDPKGETKDFIFTKIRQKDLKDPNIAIPMGIRWLFRKRQTAESKLKRTPNAEEIILEYKGLLKSTTTYKDSALKKFRNEYAKLKKK
ncbi:MAG: transglycosylase SLT domain-containing protein [Oligoflexia bacterium]|nr:transglycosylase SLT domain-containing protein [Oligoflexia bacterium]